MSFYGTAILNHETGRGKIRTTGGTGQIRIAMVRRRPRLRCYPHEVAWVATVWRVVDHERGKTPAVLMLAWQALQNWRTLGFIAP